MTTKKTLITAEFPTTTDELDRAWLELGANRDALWTLADRLREAEVAGPLSDEQIELGANVANSLQLDMLFALDSLGGLLLRALDTASIADLSAAASAWSVLSAKDREYLSRRLVGSWHFVDDFMDDPRSSTVRIAGA